MQPPYCVCDQGCNTFLGPCGLEEDLRLPCGTVSLCPHIVATRGNTISMDGDCVKDRGYLGKSEVRVITVTATQYNNVVLLDFAAPLPAMTRFSTSGRGSRAVPMPSISSTFTATPFFLAAALCVQSLLDEPRLQSASEPHHKSAVQALSLPSSSTLLLTFLFFLPEFLRGLWEVQSVLKKLAFPEG